MLRNNQRLSQGLSGLCPKLPPNFHRISQGWLTDWMTAWSFNLLTDWLYGLVWSGLVWSGLVWSGLVWSVFCWTGRSGGVWRIYVYDKHPTNNHPNIEPSRFLLLDKEVKEKSGVLQKNLQLSSWATRKIYFLVWVTNDRVVAYPLRQ